MISPQWAFFNNIFLPVDEARLHGNDLAFQRGYGVFDFFKLQDGRPVFLKEHLDRFFGSALHMHLSVGKTREELEAILLELMNRNQMPDSGIRITLTGGYSSDGFQLGLPNLLITQQLFQAPGPEQRQKGIRLVTYPFQRQLPQVKTIDYLMAIWLQPFIREQQADEVLYHHQQWITESPRSNFFMVTEDQRIITPRENVLNGITRQKLLTLAQSQFHTEEREIHLEELNRAREAFLTSTTKTILPVVAINGKPIGQGTVGSITRELISLWQSRHPFGLT